MMSERRHAFLPILFAGVALLVHPSGLLAQGTGSVRISAEVLVLPERALIEQGRTGEAQPAEASVRGSLLEGKFVRVAIERDTDALQSRIDFIAN